jgi:hypothetical protein
MTCEPVLAGKGKSKKTIEECTTKLTSSTVTFTSTGARIVAVLSRGKTLYATGSAIESGRKSQCC